jgi:site-specific DNA recombinase
MTVSIGRELAALQRHSVPELRRRYADVFGEATPANNRAWLIKRIAWRLQALAEGDLSQRARQRAAELACDADLRLSPPQPSAASTAAEPPAPRAQRDQPDGRLPPVGTMLTRPYKGDTLQVQVLADGFLLEGQTYRSLSACAKAITGSHCNGFILWLDPQRRCTMTRIPKNPLPEPRACLPVVRCAIYTRKSTEEGLEQEFNSLDAQREAGEAYIKSKAHEGWTCLPERYDDGGFTGGNTDRPALQRLLAAITAGQVDAVCVYKVDRLSRSLLDFAGLMQIFERHHVAFVSVTQLFNTATSMGRLILNVLLSFAQFERELIAERTRDKIAATRRKGKWAGSHPLLGFDLDPKGGRLAVNPDEADRVRAIFALYQEHGGLLPVVQELDHRGWLCKRWQTRKGPTRGGQPFTRTSLYRLLRNIAYVGEVRYKDEVHDGEQPAIVDPVVYQRVQELLRQHGPRCGPPAPGRLGALLKGLLRCRPCDCAMTPTHTTRGGRKRYRYYVCSHAQKRGWRTCPSKAVPAAPLEQFVLDQVRELGRDPALLEEVLAQARAHEANRIAALKTEQCGLEQELAGWQGQVRKLSGQFCPEEDNGPVIARLAELQERMGRVEERVRKVQAQIRALHQQWHDDDQAALARSLFDPAWAELAAAEQARALRLLVERVDYDGAAGKVAVTFQPAGIRVLAHALAETASAEAVG